MVRRKSREQGAESGFGEGTSGRRDLDILRERYARGEITKEQYEQMRRDLQELKEARSGGIVRSVPIGPMDRMSPRVRRKEGLTVAVQKAYGFGVQVNLPYAEAVEKTKAALKSEGFGVLCEIDVRKTMKEKLGAEFRPYVILGACNPALAHRALQTELDLGLLLPCNVAVYDADGGSVVEAMDPEPVLGIVGNPQLDDIAREVKVRMQRVIEVVAGPGS